MQTELYAALRSMALTLITATVSQEALTREAIAKCVDQVLHLNPEWAGPEDRLRLIKDLEASFVTWIGTWQSLGDNEDHLAWLPAVKGGLKWPYWERYRQYLLKGGMAPQAVERLDELTDDILGRLEDSHREGAWDRRGLVVGHVQSGKTANYAGLICKAADAGYKLVVVLAGMHKNLRSQTQIRLDEAFLGYDSMPVKRTSQGARRSTGVGLIDPNIVANTITNRLDNGDFKRSVAENFNIAPGGLPLLFVVKKNASVLKNILSWVDWAANDKDAKTGKRLVADVPLLLIDDEADHSSVDTKGVPIDEDGRPVEDYNPAMINRCIRQLLYSFRQSAYVGYTATPFANIFIYEEAWAADCGEDLFPRSFIISLPAASNYTGPVRLFGLASDPELGLEESAALPLIRHIEDAVDGELPSRSGWMPPGHKKTHVPEYNGRRSVPPSLRTAVLSFILTCAARAARGNVTAHNSMLVHVTRFTMVQEHVGLEIKELVADLRRRLTFGEGSSETQLIHEIQELWASDYAPTTLTIHDPDCPTVEWADVAPRIAGVAGSLVVRVINGTAGDILDYETHKEIGLNVIAVGGDKLARGLTLEGLSVSYFLRASKMYDTLMQMGRWFGYRTGYLDLCRLYLPQELHEWFEHITAANEELRLEFNHMAVTGGTPADYGLKVRSHPDLMVTSMVKMRSGTALQISYSGVSSETVVFDREREVNARNLQAVESLVNRLGPPDSRGSVRREDASPQSTHLWIDRDADGVSSFLRGYKTHEAATKVHSGRLADFIDKVAGSDELTSWTVALISVSGSEQAVVGGLPVGMVRRALHPNVDFPGRYVIRRLLSPLDEAIDLSAQEYEKAMGLTLDRFERDAVRLDSHEPPTRPGGPEIREVRPASRGLLLLYPILLTKDQEAVPHVLAPTAGFGLSFPNIRTMATVTYIVANKYWEQEFAMGALDE